MVNASIPMNISRMQNDVGSSTYYDKGSEEPAAETPLTIQKLEKRRHLTPTSKLMVIVLVGLPGRGKSFVARKLLSFLTWRGDESKIFNVGKYRRQAASSQSASQESSEEEKHVGPCNASFFDDSNKEATALRHAAAAAAIKDMLSWLDNDDDTSSDSQSSCFSSASCEKGRIAIFDATNSTRARRNWVLQECTCPIKRKDKPTGVVFVESICDDKELLGENFHFKISNSPDYKGVNPDEAMADLRARVAKYEEKYETITDDNLSYIKIFNLSSKLLVNHIYGRMAKTIVPALMAWNIGTRPVFLCRAGNTARASRQKRRRSTGDRGNRLDGEGFQFRDDLESFIRSEGLEFMKKRAKAVQTTTGTSLTGISSKISGVESPDGRTLPFPCVLMSSTMPRAVQTVTWEGNPFEIQQCSSLNPLDKGDFSGMELHDIRKEAPEWYSQLEQDPFYTRFPGGESYRDLIVRLEPVIIDVEQQVAPVVVVSHLSIIQVLAAYFRNSPIEKCASIEVPMHSVLKYTPARGGGWTEQSFSIGQQEGCSGLSPSSRPSESSLSDLSADERRNAPIWADPIRKP